MTQQMYKAKDHSDRSINALVGKKVVGVRHMTKEELEMLDWNYTTIADTTVIQFADGTLVVACCDPEMNDAGYLYVQEKSDENTKE